MLPSPDQLFRHGGQSLNIDFRYWFVKAPRDVYWTSAFAFIYTIAMQTAESEHTAFYRQTFSLILNITRLLAKTPGCSPQHEKQQVAVETWLDKIKPYAQEYAATAKKHPHDSNRLSALLASHVEELYNDMIDLFNVQLQCHDSRKQQELLHTLTAQAFRTWQGPISAWLWIWIHITTAFFTRPEFAHSNCIENVIVLLTHLDLLILCGVCAAHYNLNRNILVYEILNGTPLLDIFIKLHYYISVNHGFSSEKNHDY